VDSCDGVSDMRPLKPAEIVERVRALGSHDDEPEDRLELRLAPYTVTETTISIPQQRRPRD
jgi:hypothetical protein